MWWGGSVGWLGGWRNDNRVSKVQDLRLKTLDLTLTLDLDFRLTICVGLGSGLSVQVSSFALIGQHSSHISQ